MSMTKSGWPLQVTRFFPGKGKSRCEKESRWARVPVAGVEDGGGHQARNSGSPRTEGSHWLAA